MIWGPGPAITGSVAVATSAYAPTVSDGAVLCNAASAGFTVTLPAAAASVGRFLYVKKTDSSANAVVIDGAGAELVEDAATQSLVLQGEALTLQCDGTVWRIV